MSRRELQGVIVVCQLILSIAILQNGNTTGFPANTVADFVLSGIVYPEVVAIGDLNDDSINDIVVGNTHASRNEVGVYYQRLNHTLDPSPSLLLRPGESSAVAIGDLNNDSLNDVAGASWIDCVVTIFYQRTNNTLVSMPDVTLPVSLRPAHLSISDLNDDGLSDIIVANTQTNQLTIFFQKTNNTFGPAADRFLTANSSPRFVLAADLNSDNLIDVASANALTDTVAIFYQNTNNTMPTLPNVTLSITSSSPSVTPSSLASGDLNSDGLTDLVVGNLNAANNAVVAFFQQSDFTFPTLPNYTVSYDRGSSSLAVGDLNGDSLDDLITLNTFNFNATVYFQRCNQTLPSTADLTLLSGDTPRSVAIGQLNRDSMNDVVISNVYSDSTMIYYQEDSGFSPQLDLALGPGDLNVSPLGPVVMGATVYLNATAHNLGPCRACRVSVGFFDGDPSAGGKSIGVTSFPLVLDLEDKTARIEWPASGVGVHEIFAVVDPQNTTRESDETNNQASALIEVTPPPLPDLNISADGLRINPRSPVTNGTLITFIVNVSNTGTVDATDFLVESFEDLDSDMQIDTGETIGVEFVSILPSSAQTEVRFAWTPLSAGSHLICAFADPPPENVTEFDETNNVACLTVQVTAAFNITLAPGKRFMSFPLDLGPSDIDLILASVAGCYDYVRFYDALDVTDRWKSYVAGRSYNDLTQLDNLMGFWIDVTMDCSLVLDGPRPSSTRIDLHQGWNMVGFPSFNTSYTVANLKTDLGTAGVIVEAFDPGAAPYYLQRVSNSYVMKTGEGYWIFVPSDTNWMVDG